MTQVLQPLKLLQAYSACFFVTLTPTQLDWSLATLYGRDLICAPSGQGNPDHCLSGSQKETSLENAKTWFVGKNHLQDNYYTSLVHGTRQVI